MREELELNRRHWDEATQLHTRGDVYGVETFKAGGCSLHRVEREEVGDVRGKRLLHLQCHFGLDTLSWARRGALATGIDFSPEAITFGRGLSAETGVPAEFHCADVCDPGQVLAPTREFDIVYTSIGVLNWLPDLTPWAATIARHLAPSGFFYIVEGHPFARVFPLDEDMPKAGTFRPFFSYFHAAGGTRWPPGADYADETAQHSVGAHEWQHSLGDVIGALAQAGLVLEWLHEFPFCPWKVVAGCEEVERFSPSHAYYGRPSSEPALPLMFSLRAVHRRALAGR